MVKEILVLDTHDIRRQVLRKNDPLASVALEGDLDENTFHLGFFDKDKQQGILTVMEIESNIYQMRGMAVLDQFQGKGIGRKMLEYAEGILKQRKAKEMVLNARISAKGFYQKLGYEIISKEFNIPNVGMHVKMKKIFSEFV